MKIEIEDLKKVQLNPKDTVLVTFDINTSMDELQQTADVLHETFPRNRITFTPSTIKIEVIEEND